MQVQLTRVAEGRAYLQQDVVHIRVCLLHFIKEQHTEGLATHSLCQFPAIPIPNIPCTTFHEYLLDCRWHSSICFRTWQHRHISSSTANETSKIGRQEVQASACSMTSQWHTPGGAPISFATECRSMYSDMSSRNMASALPKYCSLRTCTRRTQSCGASGLVF